jgi:shikimate kinase
MLILLVGPKAAGKSHVGRVLADACGVEFVHVESIWLKWDRECRRGGVEPSIEGGLARVKEEVARALTRHPHVSVETTGASEPILAGLLALVPPEDLLLVRVWAGLETCLARFRARDSSDHLPTDEEVVRRVHALAREVSLSWNVELVNEGLSREEIVEAFRDVLS